MAKNKNDNLHQLFTTNLNRLIQKSGKAQVDVAKELNILPTTLNNWCTGKAMPRMGSIQVLADYFRVNKSELLEDYKEIQKNNDILSDIIIRAQRNDKFFEVMKSLYSIADNRLDMAKAVIDALNQ